MKCFNCPAEATLLVADPGVSDVYYCNKCLPSYLRERANAGQLSIPSTPKPTQTKKKAAKEPVVETPVVEETTEAPVEDPEA
jgi:hypothetical protein